MLYIWLKLTNFCKEMIETVTNFIYYFQYWMQGYRDYNLIMRYAAEQGNINIVKLMMEKGASDYRPAMRSAAYEGHIDIVKLLLEKLRKRHGDNGMYSALYSRHEFYTTLDCDYPMYCAAVGGHITIVELMMENGANDYNLAICGAAQHGHINIVKLLLEKGANNYDDILEKAVEGKHVDIVNLICDICKKQ